MEKIFKEIEAAKPQKIVFSKPKSKAEKYKKIVISIKGNT